jgi:hypothetical protein
MILSSQIPKEIYNKKYKIPLTIAAPAPANASSK